jgi:hypothetical protein
MTVNTLSRLALAAVLAAPPALAAVDLPPEGAFEATFFLTDGPGKAVEIPAAGANGSAWSFVETATYTNDAGRGFLHEVAGRCIGMGSGDDGASRTRGHCVYVDADGDQIFSTFEIGRAAPGAPRLGTKEYTGGTGKYAGLTGHADFTNGPMKTLGKDAPEVFEGHARGSYRLRPVVAGTAAKP